MMRTAVLNMGVQSSGELACCEISVGSCVSAAFSPEENLAGKREL